jgi:hypothetical protein
VFTENSSVPDVYEKAVVTRYSQPTLPFTPDVFDVPPKKANAPAEVLDETVNAPMLPAHATITSPWVVLCVVLADQVVLVALLPNWEMDESGTVVIGPMSATTHATLTVPVVIDAPQVKV